MDNKTQEQLYKLERMKTASLISESEYKELRTKILTDELNNGQIRIKDTKPISKASRNSNRLTNKHRVSINKPIYKKWWAWVCVFLIFIAIIGNIGSNSTDGEELKEADVQTPMPTEKVHDTSFEKIAFEFGIEEWIENINIFTSQYDDNVEQFSLDDVEVNSESYQLKMSDYSIITVTMIDEKVEGLIIIGSGDGTVESGVEVIGGMVIGVGSVNRGCSIDYTTSIMIELEILGSDELPSESEVVKDGIKYSFSYSDMIGSMLVITKE